MPFSGCADRLLPSEFDQTAPAVNGENVVWEDSRNADTGNGTDLFVYNIGTRSERLSPLGPASRISPRSRTATSSGSTRQAEGEGHLGRTAVRAAVQRHQRARHPDGSRGVRLLVVWSDPANNSNVYAKNLPNGPEIAVATSDAVEAYPACDTGRVVYSYSPLGGSSSIRSTTSHRSRPRSSPTSPGTSGGPRSPGTGSSGRPGRASPNIPIHIFGTNLPNGPDFVVSPNGTGHQTAPVISGSTVAWEDVRSGGRVRSGGATSRPRCPAGSRGRRLPVQGSQLAPSLFGRRVVFQNDSTGPWNVYIGQLFFFTGTG